MLRTLTASIAAVLILVLTAGSAQALLAGRQQQAATAQLQARVGSLQQVRQNWRTVQPDSLAGRELRQEALRTLDLLDRLYRQESELWAYYDTLDQSLSTHERYREDRIAYERQLAHHEVRMRDLQDRIDELKPASTAVGGIDFTSH